MLKDKLIDKVWTLYSAHLNNQLEESTDKEEICPRCALEHAVKMTAFFYEAEDVVLDDIYNIVKALREQPDETSSDHEG